MENKKKGKRLNSMNKEVQLLLNLLKSFVLDVNETNDGSNISREEWLNVMRLANHQNILPLVFEKASLYQSFLNLPEYSDFFRSSSMMISSQVIRSDSLLKLYKKLQENDLHPIVMKGIVCRELYGEYKDHRPSGDEDILIKPSEYERLKEVFEGEGFIPEKEIDYTETEISKLQEVAFFNNTTGLCIEVHFNPVGKENKWNNKANDCFIHVFDNSIEETIDGVVIKTMSHTDHLLFLIVHTLKHFIIKGVGIRQVLDVLLYMKEYGDDCDFDYIYSKVKELNGDLFFSDLIYLGNKYLGFILHTRNKENCPEKLLDDFVDSGVFGNATEARKSASLWNKTALEKKEENKFKKYLYMVFPPISYLRGAKPKLVEKPYLLPVAWFERWKRIIRKANTKKIIESKKLSQERIELLKSYKIL